MSKTTLYLLRNTAITVVLACAFGMFCGGSSRDWTLAQGWWVVLLVIGIVIACISARDSATKQLQADGQKLYRERHELSEARQSLTQAIAQTVEERESVRRAWRERAIGFPSLLALLNEYYETRDNQISALLVRKSHPAPRAADLVKQETHRRRAAESAAKQARAVLEYYESIAPFLAEFKDEITVEEEENNNSWLAEYSDEEREDSVTRYLTKTDYRKLSSTERNQLALERYWQRDHSSAELGRMYERYVGYWYESQQYFVTYNGIFKGFEDLGRDLICRGEGEVFVVQCKNWSAAKTVHEKHIFQLYGSAFLYMHQNHSASVRGAFFTTTSLSDVARDAARHLKIEVYESFKLDKSYPCIKCNVSRRTGEKIYHLPFDQQYDKVGIEPQRGELYCRTVAEAEALGFRRAHRYAALSTICP